MHPTAYRRHLRMRLVEAQVPETLHEGLIEYVAARQPMGGFLTAIAANDLTDACARADPVNRYHLCDVVQWFFNYAPAECWGSPEHVAEWLASVAAVPEVFE